MHTRIRIRSPTTSAIPVRTTCTSVSRLCAGSNVVHITSGRAIASGTCCAEFAAPASRVRKISSVANAYLRARRNASGNVCWSYYVAADAVSIRCFECCARSRVLFPIASHVTGSRGAQLAITRRMRITYAPWSIRKPLKGV